VVVFHHDGGGGMHASRQCWGGFSTASTFLRRSTTLGKGALREKLTLIMGIDCL
jgi:hypothetical protein